jgi:hypothetical protein
VAAATARAAPDLDVIFMGVLLKRGMKVPARPGLHLRQLRIKSWFGYAAVRIFLRHLVKKERPGKPPGLCDRIWPTISS